MIDEIRKNLSINLAQTTELFSESVDLVTLSTSGNILTLSDPLNGEYFISNAVDIVEIGRASCRERV